MNKTKPPLIIKTKSKGLKFSNQLWALILIVYIIVGFTIYSAFKKTELPIKDNIQLGRAINPTIRLIETVQINLELGLKKYKQKWNLKTIRWVSKVLKAGEQETKIPHQTILAIISIESAFNPYAKHYNKNKTWDFGLTQCNSPNRAQGFKYASKKLKKHKIWYSSIKNKYDMALNIMYTYGYLKWAKEALTKRSSYSEKQMIQSYNVGLTGSFSKRKRLIEIKKLYYKKWKKAKEEFI